ncbi:hypothetical protein BC477_13445 [Clavibacter michiganensis subsp. michiganensis]|uniref:Uncharacterized protein n=1 Tax=Clavibacter michiganensis subsp. michiganensis TaxID=33013 RepID=A0A251XJI8_CLAMM|nr:hypothetical protein BC477_13445 [Clavibacter michiganensis subsp. michiganensis]OUE02801.1 hypothetical protein CMMCAS07_12350 [Clavibacter michiganensis subsp. michiganensis]
MVDVHLLLEVLARVGEVHAEELAVRALVREVGGGVHPDDGSAERHHHVLELGVAADDGLVRGQVTRLVVPLLHGDDRELGLVADDDLDVLRERRGSGVVEDDDAAAERRRGDDGVRGARGGPELGAADRDGDALLPRDVDGERLAEGRPGVGLGAVLGGSAVPMRASSRGIQETDVPAASELANGYREPSSGPAMRSSSRRTGVSFQTASRPVTASNASTSVDVKRSERVWMGTVAHPPSVCARLPCWSAGRGLLWWRVGSSSSRRILPCPSR